jgi:hypothetical protein
MLSSIMHFIVLQTLELHDNMLTGQLPGAWAGMNLLEVRDLSKQYAEAKMHDEVVKAAVPQPGLLAADSREQLVSQQPCFLICC